MKKKLILAASMFLASVVGSESLYAQFGNGGSRRVQSQKQMSQVKLHMGDVHLRGTTQIRLKQEILRAYPNMNLNSAEIESVVLVAKTKNGTGSAKLIVGGSQTYPKSVYGHQNDFHRSGARTFSRVNFQNPSFSSQGAWKIKLNGNFKVRKILVQLKKQRRQNRLVVNMGDLHLAGQNQIGLTSILKRTYPNLNIGSMNLRSIHVMGKSKKGNGSVQLVVAGSAGASKYLVGSGRDFHNSGAYTFSSKMLQNPARNVKGAWKLKTKGNVKIKKIVFQFGN